MYRIYIYIVYIAILVCWFSAAVEGAGQKVYGCALPPRYGSEDSQVLLYMDIED